MQHIWLFALGFLFCEIKYDIFVNIFDYLHRVSNVLWSRIMTDFCQKINKWSFQTTMNAKGVRIAKGQRFREAEYQLWFPVVWWFLAVWIGLSDIRSVAQTIPNCIKQKCELGKFHCATLVTVFSIWKFRLLIFETTRVLELLPNFSTWDVDKISRNYFKMYQNCNSLY